MIKTQSDIAAMAKSGQLLADVMRKVLGEINNGLSNTIAIDARVEQLIAAGGGIPAFKGYRGYHYSICISINDEVVHGMPSDAKELKNGDLVSLDIGAVVDGWYSDMAESIIFGGAEHNPQGQKLITTTRESLALAIQKAVVGNTIADIGGAVQKHAEHNGYGVVRELVGHGIGRELHEDPQVPNYVNSAKNSIKLKAGMVLAIEPMVTMGDWHVKTHADGWTVETVDGSLAAHVERTVAITDKGPHVLTPLPLRP